MKKMPLFVTVFICINVLFIFLQVYKSSQIMKQSYRNQKNETTKAHLIQKKQTLTQQLYAAKNRSNIKKFAKNNLNMQTVKLNQVKKLSAHE